ncbi:MAG TPA: ABC transporter permease [Solirubrobacterales bacterium]|nr:ABC transporter permease [Solirubrobacterales bacterium]
MNPLQTRFARSARAIAWRQLHVMLTKPALILPSLIFPLFFFAAFAGGLSAVDSAPGFDYPNYTTFQYVFVLMQSAVFGGVFTGFAVAADFEFGFSRRMLLATRHRSALVAGYAIAALARALLVWAVVTVVALATGAEITGSGADLLGIAAIAVMMNFAAVLFAAGLAMRFRTLQAAPLIQLPAFLLIMTAPVYVPRELIHGWVATAADFNPMTAVLEAGRNLVIGAPAETLLAVGVAAGLIAAMLLWSRGGLRSAEAAG